MVATLEHDHGRPRGLPRLSSTLPAMDEVDATASGHEGTVIGVTVPARHAERVRAREAGELRDTGVAPPGPFTVSPRLLAEVF